MFLFYSILASPFCYNIFLELFHCDTSAYRLPLVFYVESWTNYFLTLFFLSKVVTSLLPSKKQFVKNLCSLLFQSVCLPFSIYSALVFWPVYLYNREIVYPANWDVWMPHWRKYVVHLYPVSASLLSLCNDTNISHSFNSQRLGLIISCIYGYLNLQGCSKHYLLKKNVLRMF